MAMKLNPDDVVTMTQVMACNGDVPTNVGGWRLSEGYAGGTQRMNGVLGEVARSGDTVYVCVRGCLTVRLPNTHPDYTPSVGTVWASVPSPEVIDWRYVPVVYHSRDGWRLKGAKA